MTEREINGIDWDWEAERRRLTRARRNRVVRETVREHRTELAIMVALTLGFFAFMIWWNCRQPLMERAAYNEGYYGVDHATALAMAERGIGFSGDEILKEVR